MNVELSMALPSPVMRRAPSKAVTAVVGVWPLTSQDGTIVAKKQTTTNRCNDVLFTQRMAGLRRDNLARCEGPVYSLSDDGDQNFIERVVDALGVLAGGCHGRECGGATSSPGEGDLRADVKMIALNCPLLHVATKPRAVADH